jgi:hypothetical protein
MSDRSWEQSSAYRRITEPAIPRDMFHELIPGATMNGGVNTGLMYLGADGQRCEKAEATHVLRVELSGRGSEMYRSLVPL